METCNRRERKHTCKEEVGKKWRKNDNKRRELRGRNSCGRRWERLHTCKQGRLWTRKTKGGIYKSALHILCYEIQQRQLLTPQKTLVKRTKQLKKQPRVRSQKPWRASGWEYNALWQHPCSYKYINEHTFTNMRARLPNTYLRTKYRSSRDDN